MKGKLKKVVRFTIRWGIAVVGIWIVISQMSFKDRALVLNENNRPQKVEVFAQLPDGQYRVADPDHTGKKIDVPQASVVNAPDRKKVTLDENGAKRQVYLLGMDLTGEADRKPVVRRLLVADTPESSGKWVLPTQVDNFKLQTPRPRIEVGIDSLVLEADPWLLVLAILVMPVTIICTSIRWHELLKAIEIPLSLWQTAVLNMVGMFYNTFIPTGSTGGDLLKAYYAAQHTTHKARAVISVVVDRVIGLVVLIIMGGALAGVYAAMATNREDPSVQACTYVAAMAGIIVAWLGLFLLVAFHPAVRRWLWSEKLLSRLPMRKHIESTYEVMGMYRKRPGLMIWSVLITFPVHATVVVSAMLAGKAFGLPLSWGYYWIVVPVTVLASAIPLSPQGAGFMEVVAVSLTARQGATVSQAFALTMSMRVVQILWNLVGGIFVITGHYRAPSKAAETDEVPAPAM